MAELQDISTLELWQDNYNDGDIGKIVGSILMFGYNDSLRYWSPPDEPNRKIVVAGNHSLISLWEIARNGPSILKRFDLEDRPWPPTHIKVKKQGDEHIWLAETISVSHLTKEEAEAYAIADNEIARQSVRNDKQLLGMLQSLAIKNQKAFRGTGFNADEIDFLVQTVANLPQTTDGEGEADGIPESKIGILIGNPGELINAVSVLRAFLSEHPEWKGRIG